MQFSRVLKNTSWIIACRFAQAIFALIINALTTRYFGPSNYGVISYAASLVAFVTPLMRLGTNDILVNELIKNAEDEGKVLGTSIAMTFASSIVCILGLFSFVSFANAGDSTTIMVVVLYSLLLTAQSFEQIQYWFHAKYLSKVVSISSLVVYIIVTLYKYFLLIEKKSIYWFAASNAIDHLLIAVLLYFFYSLKQGPRLTFSKNVMVNLWERGKVYIIPELMGLVLAQSDRVMLQFMRGDSEVGLYSAALSTAGMTSFVFSAIITSFRPLVLQSKLENERIYENQIIRLYGIVIYLALLQSICIMLFGDYVVGLLYGVEFQRSTPILRVVIWYTLFSHIGAVRAIWILAENKQNYLLTISFWGMLINILLNLILIRPLGGIGAALATLITQIWTNIIIVYIISPLRINIKFIVASLNVKEWI